MLCLATFPAALVAGCASPAHPSIQQAYRSIQPGRGLPSDPVYPDSTTVARTTQSTSARTSTEWKFGRHIERAAALLDEHGTVRAKHYVRVHEEAFLFLGWHSARYTAEWEMVVPPDRSNIGVESICKQFDATDREDLLPDEVDFTGALKACSVRLADTKDFDASGTANTNVFFPFAASTRWELHRQGDWLRLSMNRTANWFAIIHWPAALIMIPTMSF